MPVVVSGLLNIFIARLLGLYTRVPELLAGLAFFGEVLLVPLCCFSVSVFRMKYGGLFILVFCAPLTNVELEEVEGRWCF